MRIFASERIASHVAAVVLLCVAAGGCGREAVVPEKAPSAPPKVLRRMDDPAYQKALREVQAQRRKMAEARAQIRERMRELSAQARAALPADATDAQVKAELEGKPQTYPDWAELARRLQELEKAAEKDLREARDLVRARILKEQDDLDKQQKRGGSK